MVKICLIALVVLISQPVAFAAEVRDGICFLREKDAGAWEVRWAVSVFNDSQRSRKLLVSNSYLQGQAIVHSDQAVMVLNAGEMVRHRDSMLISRREWRGAGRCRYDVRVLKQ